MKGVVAEFPKKAWLALLAVLLLAGNGAGQSAAGPEELSEKQIRAERERLAQQSRLPEEVKQQALSAYDAALKALAGAADFERQRRRHAKREAEARRAVRMLQRELDRPHRMRTVNLPKQATAAAIEERLAQERSELNARRQALRDLAKLAERRTARRLEIAQRIGVLNQKLEALDDRLRLLSQADVPPELRRAMEVEIRATQLLHRAEQQALQQELKLIEAQTELYPLQRDRAERRVTESEQIVEQLQHRLAASRHAELQASLDKIRELCRKAAEANPLLEEPAAEVEELAERLWASDGIRIALEDAERKLTELRKYLADVDSLAALTRRKFEAVRLRGVAAQWIPNIPEDLPQPAELRQELRELEHQIPTVQHHLIVLEEQRARAGDINRETRRYLSLIEEVTGKAPPAGVRTLVRRLMVQRRELLDEAIRAYNRYADRLLEVHRATNDLVEKIEALDRYIWQRVLWSRSVPGSKLPPLRELWGGFRWLFLNRSWGGVLRTAAGHAYRDPVFLVLALLALAAAKLRKRGIQILERQADNADASETGAVGWALAALAVTALLAAPVPLAFAALGRFFQLGGQDALARAVSAGCLEVGGFAAGFLLLAEVLRPRGLGEAHFAWRREVTEPVRSVLRQVVALTAPVIFVALALGAVGLRFHSPPDLRAYSDALGRVCFIAASWLLALAVHRLVGRGGLLAERVFEGDSASWGARLQPLWAPLATALVAAPGILALLGYYVTGVVLLYNLVRTLFLTVLLPIAGELLVYWRTVRERMLPTGRRSGNETELEVRQRLAEATMQLRRLTRFILGFVWIAGLAVIWSQVLPAFEFFERVQVWPEVKVLEETDLAGAAARPLPESAAEPASQATPSAAQPLVRSASGAQPPGAAAGGSTDSPLLLSDILESLVVLIFTFILARNLPGALEFAVLRQMPIGPGGRNALTTLVRYFITIVGVSAAAGMLGLSWNKIQWLAAALTFGLGFGLQEIFANFVSGVIILIDRPFRVGDVISVGDIGGWVTRISIRATTITKWDRSELIVPNKEFITGQVVNWTLSNSLTRVELRVGVAYESDVEQVRKVLLEVAEAHPAVLREPPPYVVLMEFAASSIDFELRVYINYDYGRLTVRDELSRAIVHAFREHGITIAYPQLDLHIRSDEREILPPQRWLPPERAPRGIQDGDE